MGEVEGLIVIIIYFSFVYTFFFYILRMLVLAGNKPDRAVGPELYGMTMVLYVCV